MRRSRVALIFPPQWDPRQPPLCIPSMAGALRKHGHSVKAWDINLHVYRQLLETGQLAQKAKKQLQDYLSPTILNNAKEFSRLSSSLEDVIYFGYDRNGQERLYWDSLESALSPDRSRDWQAAATNFKSLPLYGKSIDTLLEITRWNPDIIGISAVSDTQVIAAIAIASALRSELPHAKIVLGGNGFASRQSLYQKVPWLFKIVNGICVLEGEPALLSLAARLPIDKIPNLITFDDSKPGCIIQNKHCHKIDDFVPDFSVLPLEQYLSPLIVMPVQTARGCPWGKCAFCNHNRTSLPAKYRYQTRTTKVIREEVGGHYKNGVRYFCFVDEALPPERFLKISKLMSSVGKDIKWLCYLRLDGRHSFEMFRKAKSSGCKKIFFGLETASTRLLKLHKKGVQPITAKRVIRDASKAGIALHLFLITSFPDESSADSKATLDFMSEIISDVDKYGFTYDVFQFEAELNTDVYREPAKYGAAKINVANKNDMAWRFKLSRDRKQKSMTFVEFERAIKTEIESQITCGMSLRSLGLSQDSLHLLLLDARNA